MGDLASPFDQLPDEVVLLIFGHLATPGGMPALAALCRTSRRLRALADSRAVWSVVLVRVLPRAVVAAPEAGGAHRGAMTYRRCHRPPHQELAWPGSTHLDDPLPFLCRIKSHYVKPRPPLRNFRDPKAQVRRIWRSLLLKHPKYDAREEERSLQTMRAQADALAVGIAVVETVVEAKRENRERLAAVFRDSERAAADRAAPMGPAHSRPTPRGEGTLPREGGH